MDDDNEEQRMLQELVAKFVTSELMPLEPTIIAREASGGRYALTEEEEAPLLARCAELGLRALDVPQSLGGAELPPTVLMRVEEELARTIVPFTFPPDSPCGGACEIGDRNFRAGSWRRSRRHDHARG